MDIQIVEHVKEALQVIIRCKQIDDEIMQLKSHDNRTYLYTKDDVMEVKQRLYELEIILSDKDFIRISKSQIVNINKIRSLKPELNRTILATMCNGEHLCISRKYVQAIRNMLSI